MTELTVLGSCGAWPEPGRACGGFLFRDGDIRIAVDLGYGTAAPLLDQCPDGSVDAVVITHEHPDHCVDLSALARARYYHAHDRPRVPLYCPPGVVRVLTSLEPSLDPAEVFDVHDLTSAHRIGPVELSATPLPHHVPNFGVRLDCHAGTVAYTGDSGPCEALTELGKDADVFVVEATLAEPAPSGPRYLMTASEAATAARRAGAKRLLLTHFWPGSDRQAAVGEAAGVFGGEVLAADEGLVVPL